MATSHPAFFYRLSFQSEPWVPSAMGHSVCHLSLRWTTLFPTWERNSRRPRPNGSLTPLGERHTPRGQELSSTSRHTIHIPALPRKIIGKSTEVIESVRLDGQDKEKKKEARLSVLLQTGWYTASHPMVLFAGLHMCVDWSERPHQASRRIRFGRGT